MSPANVQFLKVLALFFWQGQLIWYLSFWDTHAVNEAWAMALFGAIVAWWPVWFGLHRERTWRPWLETALIMGATFWLPLYTDHWVRPLWGNRQFFLFPPEAVLYLMLYYAVVFTPVVAAFWCCVHRLTWWQFQSPHKVRVHLRDFFLLMAAVAIHIMSFLPTIKQTIEQRTWPIENGNAAEFVRTCLFLSALLGSLSLLVFGAAWLVMAEGKKRIGAIIFSVGAVAFAVTTGTNQSAWDSRFFTDVAIAEVTILVQATLTALALRWLGYRLGTKRASDAQNGSMISPSARLPN